MSELTSGNAAQAVLPYRGGLIKLLPEALMWTQGGVLLERAYQDYVAVLADALGHVLVGIRRESKAEGADLLFRVERVPAPTLLRVLVAPDTANRLLWRRPEMLPSTAAFLRDSFIAEEARETGQGPQGRTIWSALGDGAVMPYGEWRQSPWIDGSLPLDLDSPTVSTVHPLGSSAPKESVLRPLAQEDRDTVLERLSLAYKGIRKASPVAAQFIDRFMRVLVLQADDTTSFAAYSNARYIGRPAMSNPQLVDEVALADSLVHETMHGLLYSQIHRRPWGLRDDLQDEPGVAISPWSGRELPLSTFLHACFVWYGLVHFWVHAHDAAAFDSKRSAERLAKAVSGFLRGPIFSNLVEPASTTFIEPDIIDAIERMQELVVDAAAETPVTSEDRP